MDTKQVNDALDKLFQQQRIIFWNDPDREFVGSIEEIRSKFTTDNTERTDKEIENKTVPPSVSSVTSVVNPVQSVRVIRLDQIGALQAKLQIERDEPSSKFLIYSPEEEPNYEDDWLLDIRLYPS